MTISERDEGSLTAVSSFHEGRDAEGCITVSRARSPYPVGGFRSIASNVSTGIQISSPQVGPAT